MHIRSIRCLATSGMIVSLLAGCGAKYAVDVPYPHPAQIRLGGHVRTLAVYAFAAADGTDPTWAATAGDRLVETLDVDDPRYTWEQVIAPAHLTGLLAGLGLADTPGDEKTALWAAEVAGAHAVITGAVAVDCSESRSAAGAVASIRRTCTARIDFRLSDPAASATLATRTIQRRYDSADPSAELIEADRAVRQLIDGCVADFARMLASYEMRVTIDLRPGKTYTANLGSRLADNGEYGQALALYERSLGVHPDDDGTVFNAGVMHEAMGQLDAALERYDRAFQMAARDDYAQARDRVRLRLRRQY